MAKVLLQYAAIYSIATLIFDLEVGSTAATTTAMCSEYGSSDIVAKADINPGKQYKEEVDTVKLTWIFTLSVCCGYELWSLIILDMKYGVNTIKFIYNMYFRSYKDLVPKAGSTQLRNNRLNLIAGLWGLYMKNFVLGLTAASLWPVFFYAIIV